VPEPGNGWLVRPHVEPHGPDGLDLMEGFYVEKSGVARRAGQDMLQGVPYSTSLSAQCSKEQLLLQVGAAAGGAAWAWCTGGGCAGAASAHVCSAAQMPLQQQHQLVMVAVIDALACAQQPVPPAGCSQYCKLLRP
jgi:hypothetical protein